MAELEVFVTVARAASFRKAAEQRGLTPSAISHAIAAMEARLGVRLFHRTTRTLRLTDVGEMLLDELAPRFEAIEQALDKLQHFRETPKGRVRISALRDAVHLLVGPKLAGFAQRYPEIEIELSSDDRFVDLLGDGYDAGIRYGGTVPGDMVGARLSPDLRWVVVGAPSYLDARGRPQHPRELLQHECIRMRIGTNRIYQWELGAGSDQVVLDVRGNITLCDTASSLMYTVSGGGLYYCLEQRVEDELRGGQLEIVLPDWSVTGPGFYAYYSSHRRVPTALRAFIDYLKEG